MDKISFFTEKIICPKCGAVQTAKVDILAPFCDYTHICDKCGYVITESEWNEA